MHFTVTADTDIGIAKDTNQDSLMVKHAQYGQGEVLAAILCDGMGGLSKGEVASAAVIREFSQWFEQELPYELEHLDMQVIGEKWSLLLKEQNQAIMKYGQKHRIELGTTFTGILIAQNQYVITHVGDTRLYQIGTALKQLTTDQTYVAREISRGTMTIEEAKNDKRRNMLLQCVGASEKLDPEILTGNCEQGVYLLCSDGFRHEVSEAELYENLNPAALTSKETMHTKARYLMELAKQRNEKDNISVILIQADKRLEQ